MRRATQALLNELNLEAELAGVLRLGLANLQFHDDVAQLFDVEEQQVDEELVAVYVGR